MHLGEISFCDKVAYNIKSDDYKKTVLDDLYNLFGFKVVQKHFDKFSEMSMTNLCKNPHLLTVRTNGNPYLLYLTKYNFANQCIFIDKKIQHGYFYPRMIIAKLWFDDSLFEGTLLDGEMIKTNDGSWEYIINDIISERRNDMNKVNIAKRATRLYEILSSMYIEDDTCCCKIRVKKFFTYEQLPYIINEYIPSLDYTCRGIYFRPLYIKFKDVLMNFDDNLIKKVIRTKYKDLQNTTFLTQDIVKAQDEKYCDSFSNESSEKEFVSHSHPDSKKAIDLKDNTVCKFFIKKTNQPDIYELYGLSDTQTNELACVPDLKTSKMLRSVFINSTLTDKKLFTCSFSSRFSKWIPTSLLDN
jgi:hypothetical protein